MKHTFIIILMVFGLISPAFSQVRGREWNRLNIPQPEAVTVSGNLIVAHGFPAIRSGDITYLTLGVNRLVGFIDGLVEGAFVTIAGHSMSSPGDENLRILRPTELNFSGRTYDLTLPRMRLPESNRDRFQAPGRRGTF